MNGVLFDLPLSETIDFDLLLRTPMPGDVPIAMVGRRITLKEHLAELQSEFAGASQLDFFHGALIVLIRRQIDKERAYRHFEQAWTTQSGHLLSSLNSRWLVSACDTIMDCASDPTDRAIACVGSTLLNTIKLYETERLCAGPPPKSVDDLIHPAALFDGMTSFSVGRGDMVHNLRVRTQSIASGGSPASKILLELLSRSNRADTVYRRLGSIHSDPATQWLNERDFAVPSTRSETHR